MVYKLRITFNVSVAKWRIDNPLLPDSSDWALQVWDRNLDQWVYLADCIRPGEKTFIEKIEVLDADPATIREQQEYERKTSGSKPEDSTDDDNSEHKES